MKNWKDYHSKYWKFDYGWAAKNYDFAHELIQYSIFSHDDSLVHQVWNFCGIFGEIEAMASYKGDIYSTRMGDDDRNSDIDAVNLYQRFSNSEDNILEIMVDYNNQVSNGTINRAEEFLKNIGNGDAEKGYELLEKELDNVDIASQYLDPDNGGIKSIIQDIFWYDAIAESGAATLGEETMENLFDKSNQAKTEKSQKINEKKDRFLQYVYEEWKKKEN